MTYLNFDNFSGGNCLTFWYSMSGDAGTLMVQQQVRDQGTDHNQVTFVRQGSNADDTWMLGYAEMYPTAYAFNAVFEAYRGLFE